LHDRVKARELQTDGSYRRLKPEGKEPRAQAQWHFREVSRERTKKMTASKKKISRRQINSDHLA
jgi:Polyphosphate kinase